MLVAARFFLLSLVLAVTLGGQTQTGAPQDSARQPEKEAPAQQQTPAQQAPAVYESATVLKTITRLVVVDVVATGKKGEAVTDLKRSEFTLLEDGKEQSIKVFNFQKPSAVPATITPVAHKLPDNVYTNIPQFNTNSTTLNVVLLDSLNTTLLNQAYVREQMIHYLEKMPEGRPVAVYTLGTKLTLVQDFTADPAILKDVIRKLKSKNSPLLENPSGGPNVEVLPPGIADSMPQQMLQSIMRFEQESTSTQTGLRVTYTIAAMNAIARYLSGYPGRKNLVWVSEAFPLSVDPNMELTGDVFAGTRNFGPQVAEAADRLIDAQIAIYPVDARGLVAPSMFSASNSGNDNFGRPLRGDRMGTALSAESAQLQSVHGTMQEMADRTGGKAFYNRNDIDGAIRSSIEDGSTYYTLAYYPDNKNWNGKFRKVHVKVDRADVKLRYRLGYYAVDPQAFAAKNQKQQAAVLGEALALDAPAATGLLFRAGVLPPSEKTQNKVLVNFALDPHAISFETQSDGLHHAQVDCVVMAYSDKAKYVKAESTTINAALKPDTFAKVMQTGFPCQQTIELTPGKYYLRLGVLDDHTGLIGTAAAKITVPPADTAAASEKVPEEKKP